MKGLQTYIVMPFGNRLKQLPECNSYAYIYDDKIESSFNGLQTFVLPPGEWFFNICQIRILESLAAIFVHYYGKHWADV